MTVVTLDHRVLTVADGPVARAGATEPLTSLSVRDPGRRLIEVSVGG